jgi:hypothetical protein
LCHAIHNEATAVLICNVTTALLEPCPVESAVYTEEQSGFPSRGRQPLDQSLPAYPFAQVPPNLGTRRQWKRRRRKVRKGEKPVARLQWAEWDVVETERFETDGTQKTIKEKRLVVKECGLFSEGQTAPYRATGRTVAINIFCQYFLRFTSRDYYLWWLDEPLDGGKPGWRSCSGRLPESHAKKHISGTEKYGVRGGKKTRFGAIDLDLHEGDPEIFLAQFRVLLDEFHGKDGWHFQVSDTDAGGVHLIQTFREPLPLGSYRQELRRRLGALDDRHPELAARARAAGMKTLGELEIFPNTQDGFRLPLCAGRTMLLDRPLPRVLDKRLKREVGDVVGYVSWLTRDDKRYMPADDVFNYVKARLRTPQPKPQRVEAEPAPKPKKQKKEPSGSLGSLGKMKGRYSQVLADFWQGRLAVPDTLNTGIRLLALPLPYYLDEDEAIELIERFVDELPDVTFSDRLTCGDRPEVSRIIRNTVRQVYNGNGGQPDPELSARKLQATVAAWKRRGFDPTDKSTWDRASSVPSLEMAPDFCWTAEEVMKLGTIQRLLNVSLQVASEATKWFLRLVRGHKGEIAVPFVKKALIGFGVKCGRNGKVNAYLRQLRQWDWICIVAPEKWNARDAKRKGRARTYAIGESMIYKFEGRRKQKAGQGAGADSLALLRALAALPIGERERERHLYITSHPFSVVCPVVDLRRAEPTEHPVSWAYFGVERNKGSP